MFAMFGEFVIDDAFNPKLAFKVELRFGETAKRKKMFPTDEINHAHKCV